MTSIAMTLVLDRDSLDGISAGTELGEVEGTVIPPAGSGITVEYHDAVHEYVVNGADDFVFTQYDRNPPRLTGCSLFVVKRGLSLRSEQG